MRIKVVNIIAVWLMLLWFLLVAVMYYFPVIDAIILIFLAGTGITLLGLEYMNSGETEDLEWWAWRKAREEIKYKPENPNDRYDD